MKKSENHNDSGKPIFRIKRDFCWQKLYFTYIKACAYSEKRKI